MGKRDNRIPFAILSFGAVIIAIMLVPVFFPGAQTPWSQGDDPSQTPQGDQVSDGTRTKLVFSVYDILDSGTTTPAGTIAIYDPDDPGMILEPALTLSSGTITSAQSYIHGRELFAKYIPAATTTHFEFGGLFTVPSAAGYTSIPELPALNIGVYKMGDIASNSTNKDLKIQLQGTTIWDGYVTLGAAVDGINPETDDGKMMSILCSNEDSNTVYCDPRPWTDYSEIVTTKQNKAAYLIVNMELTGSSNVHTKVSDYSLAFDDAGGAEWIHFGAKSALVKKIDTETLAGFYDLEAGKVYDAGYGSRNGVDTMLEVIFDFDAMSSTNYADEIDIELAIVNMYSLEHAKAQNNLAYETFNSGSAAHLFGELGSTGAWDYDISMG